MAERTNAIVAIRNGAQIPEFKRVGNPSPVSASDMNLLVRALRSLLNPSVIADPTGKTRIEITDSNWFLIVGGAGLSDGNGDNPPPPVGSGAVSLYKFVSMGSEHIICNPWVGPNDNDFDTGNNVKIAKPYKLRFTITSADIDGFTITYSDYNAGSQTRVATVNDRSETQVIVPRYLPGDLIFVSQPNHTNAHATVDVESSGTEAVSLLDMNVDGRAWARKFNGIFAP